MLQPCFGLEALDELAELLTDAFKHLQQIIGGFSNLPAEKLKDAANFGADQNGETKCSIQARLCRRRSLQDLPSQSSRSF